MNIPQKLKNGDQYKSTIIDAINSIIDYLSASRMIQGDGIRLQQHSAGTIISATAVAGSKNIQTDIPYYSDFSIIDLSKYDSEGNTSNFKIAVCHAFSWNHEKEYSRSSHVIINGWVHYVSSIVFDNVSQKGTYSIYVVVPDNFERKGIYVEMGHERPSNNGNDFYYEIGKIIDGTIVQTHKSGALVLYTPVL